MTALARQEFELKDSILCWILFSGESTVIDVPTAAEYIGRVIWPISYL